MTATSGDKMLVLLAIGSVLQPADQVRLPVEAYGPDGWRVSADPNGLTYELADARGDRTTRHFRPARVARRGATTVLTSRTAAGKPVILTIEPGECRASPANQTALRAKLEMEGRIFTGCAEDGASPRKAEKPTLLGDYVMNDGVQASGMNGEWLLRLGGWGGNALERGDDRLHFERGQLLPRIARGVATYSAAGPDGRRATAIVRAAPCTLRDGSRHNLTVEVRTGGATLKGCGWQGNYPLAPMMMSDGGSGPELRSGSISNDLDYPAAALQARASGAVTVRYMVGANGRVTACSVLQSSGDASLDSTTCSLLQRRFRFDPARDRAGQPREAQRSFRMVWRLPAR